MIRCLASGRLHDAPQARTSQSGNTFVTGKLRADGRVVLANNVLTAAQFREHRTLSRVIQ